MSEQFSNDASRNDSAHAYEGQPYPGAPFPNDASYSGFLSTYNAPYPDVPQNSDPSYEGTPYALTTPYPGAPENGGASYPGMSQNSKPPYPEVPQNSTDSVSDGIYGQAYIGNSTQQSSGYESGTSATSPADMFGPSVDNRIPNGQPQNHAVPQGTFPHADSYFYGGTDSIYGGNNQTGQSTYPGNDPGIPNNSQTFNGNPGPYYYNPQPSYPGAPTSYYAGAPQYTSVPNGFPPQENHNPPDQQSRQVQTKNNKTGVSISGVILIIIAIVLFCDGIYNIYKSGFLTGGHQTNSESSSATESSETSSENLDPRQAEKAAVPYTVTIDGAQEATDLKGEQAIIVTYTFTNNSDEARSLLTTLDCSAYQDNVELSYADVPGVDSFESLNDVKPGGAITCQLAYELRNRSPVTVECKENSFIKTDILATELFNLN